MITAPTLRLDRDPHRGQLLETAKRLRPRLLLLDPLVRLHGIDENHATEVAGLLAYFRLLQRRLDLSVVLVHHTRKNAAGGVAAGQGLRGSSDLHAFGDSNLYLRRTRDRLVSVQRAPCGAGFAAGVSGACRDRRRDDPSGGRRRSSGRETNAVSRSRCWLFWPAAQCSRERSSATRCRSRTNAGRGTGVPGASRPDPPHASWLATHRLSRRGPFPVPHIERGNGTVLLPPSPRRKRGNHARNRLQQASR